MFFNFGCFFKALRLSLLEQRFSPRRWGYVLGFSVLYVLFVTVVAIARWVDGLLWRDIQALRIKAPVFIIAPPRSGTSFLQRLMACDSERFAYWRFYQTILPSVLLDRFLKAGAAVDRRVGQPVGRVLDFLQKRCFGGWDGLHTMRLTAPEEDGALYLYAFACEAIYMLFPFVEELWALGFPDSLAHAQRIRLMDYYRSCLQRLLFSSGPGKVVLVKSTNSSGAIGCILDAFPDARIVSLYRNPGQSIPSSISLMMPALRAHSPEIEAKGHFTQSYARMSAAWYRHLHDTIKRLPADQVYMVNYDALIHSPRETVLALYRHFDWTPSKDFIDRLNHAADQATQFKSSHRYSLEQYGLSLEWLEEELGEVLKAHEAGGQ